MTVYVVTVVENPTVKVFTKEEDAQAFVKDWNYWKRGAMYQKIEVDE